MSNWRDGSWRNNYDGDVAITGDLAVTGGISGPGSGITGINASNIGSGTTPLSVLPDYQNEDGIGGYRLDTGLDRFRGAYGYTAPGAGGIDVVIEGDSILEGANDTDWRTQGMVHALTVGLQNALNPPSVPGGAGFIPFVAGAAHASWGGTAADIPGTALGNVWGYADTGWAVGVASGVRGLSGITSTNGVRAGILFDGTQTPDKRAGVTDLQLVGTQGAIIGNWLYDVKAGATPLYTAGSGDAATGAVTGGGSTEWGHRWPVISSLDPYKSYGVQVTAPASGSVYLDGVIAYNGDYQAGVRVHNLGRSGTTCLDASYYSANQTAAHDLFGAATGSGATNAKLVIMDWITNHVNASSIGTYLADVTAFSTAYGTRIDHWQGLASKPSVLLVVPPPFGGMTADQKTIWAAFKAAVYALADARSHVAVLDLGTAFGGGYPNDAGGSIYGTALYSDGTHYTDAGHAGIARILLTAILGSPTSGSAALPATALTSKTNTFAARQEIRATSVGYYANNSHPLQLADPAAPTKHLNIGYDLSTDTHGVGYMQAIAEGLTYTRLFLNPEGGDVSIGNANPQYALDVTGVVNASGGVRIGGPTWTSGAGSPEGAVAAPVGSLYSNTSGGASTTLYVKTSGTGNTGWTAK